MNNNRKYIILGVVIFVAFLIYKRLSEAKETCTETEQARLNRVHCNCQGVSKSSNAVGRIPVTNSDGFLPDTFCTSMSQDERDANPPCPCAKENI